MNWFLTWILTAISTTITHFYILYKERKKQAREKWLYERIIQEKKQQIKILKQMKQSLEKNGNINDLKWVSRDIGKTVKEAKEIKDHE